MDDHHTSAGGKLNPVHHFAHAGHHVTRAHPVRVQLRASAPHSFGTVNPDQVSGSEVLTSHMDIIAPLLALARQLLLTPGKPVGVV